MTTDSHSNDSKWHRLVTCQIAKYKDMSDAHWQALNEGADPMACDTLQIHEPTEAERWQQLLLLSARTAPQFDLATEDRERRNSLIKKEMYRKLGLWLCSYFLGVPHPYYWEEIKELAFKLDAYPGGAFYDKLAGDVYRFERRQRLKALARNTPPTSSVSNDEGILVMAYTPLCMIPDEHDLAHTEQMLDWSSEEERIFRSEVEKLACRFLRLHGWRYCNDGHGHPITYLVSYDAVFEALNETAILNVAYEQTNGSHGSSIEQFKKRVQYLKSSDAASVDKERVNSEITKLRTHSDLRIRKFFKSRRSKQHLIVLGPDAVRRRGLTSCIIGRDDGVIANRPNRSEDPTAYCEWAEGEVLNVERQKLQAVLQLAKDTNDCFKFDSGLATGFSHQWYDKLTPFGQSTDRIHKALEFLYQAGVLSVEEVTRHRHNNSTMISDVPTDLGEV